MVVVVLVVWLAGFRYIMSEKESRERVKDWTSVGMRAELGSKTKAKEK